MSRANLSHDPARLDPHVQLQLAVDAVHAFVVPAKAFDVPKMQKAQAKAMLAVLCRTAHSAISLR